MNNRENNDKMLVSIENTNNRIEQLKTEIENYNKKLPFKSEAGNIKEVRLNKDIKLYYSNLWKSKIDNDIKYVNYIKSWISRIENRNNEDYDSFKQIYINNANVIGITCNQSGSKEFTVLYPTFDMAIIDEVSKATPPELILSMLKARKLVLVGDHRQLPPMIGLETYLEVAKKLGIDIKKTQHMKKSLFEELYNSASDNLKMMLKTQYRMHNQIMETINQFYLDDSKQGLECGINKPDSTRRHNCHGKIINEENHVLWVDVPLKYEYTEKYSIENFSYSNIEEVECIKNILLLLSKNLYNNNEKQRKDVGIISFYSNQVRLLEKEILNQSFLNMTPNLSFRIGSVDRFQGIEASIIICSFVRNNLIGDIGFAKDPRRVNVALSRAKELSIIVGCQELFCSVNKNDKSSTIYNNILQVIANNGGFRSVVDFR
jgi:superfamily I DNA and/or RNA helicase